uniref:Uncharacterized protein n=1 Tax=Tanacetum cinerariifolium TaxID=118510 RepID=A0A6L2P0F9_TANCI|nr:hypothetical protein [Tanacetum cinerariifolium]
MSSITAQQAKLDLECVHKEKRLEIRKCNERLNPGEIQREPTFQVILDALALTPCYFAFLITADVPEDQDFDAPPTDDEIVSFLREFGHTREINSLNDVFDHMHQPWRTFDALINKSLSGKTTGLDKLHRNKIGMHTSRDDYLINTLRFVSAKEDTQIYGAIRPESLTSPEIKETQAYQTYLGFATRATPPKKARKFKKPASPKLTTVLASTETLTRKSKRVKRSAKKSTETPARGVVIRETPEMPLTKKKEKVDVTRGKGIELLSQVALTEDARFKEGKKKSMRDFHKTHPSGSGTVTKTALSVVKIKPFAITEGTDDINNEEVSSDEDSDQEKDSDDEKTHLNNENESDLEHETNENESGLVSDNDESEENKEDHDDEDEKRLMIKLKVEGTDAAMTIVQQGNENPKILQVIKDAHVTLFIVPQKTKVPVTNSSHSSDLATKFLNFLDIPHTDAEIVSPLDVYVHHEVPSQQTPTLLTVHVLVITDSSPVFFTIIPQSLPSFIPLPQQSSPTQSPSTEATNPQTALPNFTFVFQFNNRVTSLEKEVAELKKDDPLKTQVTVLVDEHLDTRIGATRDEFMNFLSASITARIMYSLKRRRKDKDKDKDEDPSVGSNQGLKKRKTSKDAEPTKCPKAKESQSSSSKGDKSKSKSSGKFVQ